MKISGGGFGSAIDMTADANISDAGGGATLLKWSGQAEARGPIAAIGGRVLDAQAHEADRGGLRQRPAAIVGLRWPAAYRCPGSRSANDSFRCTSQTRSTGSSIGFPWSIIFKAGTSDKTVDAWLVAQKVLEPRVDVAVGFVRLPEDRPASDRVSGAHADVPHRSPQLLLFEQAPRALSSRRVRDRSRSARPAARASTFRPTSDRRSAMKPWSRSSRTGACSPRSSRAPCPKSASSGVIWNVWRKRPLWRDDETFAVLNSLFENEWGRDVRAARLIAVEFQGQLAGRLEPLKARARAAARAA